MSAAKLQDILGPLASRMDLRKIDLSKIECARNFFAKITSDQIKYEVGDSFAKLPEVGCIAADRPHPPNIDAETLSLTPRNANVMPFFCGRTPKD